MTTITITGNTYPVKEQIKAIGGRWNKAAQGWNVPADRAEEARALVASAGPAEPRPAYVPRPSARRSARRRTVPAGSRYSDYYYSAEYSRPGEAFTNPRGRCEDAPCCGCCS